MSNETIEAAIEKLNPITYNPNPIAYYVLLNGTDMGGEDYCLKCIPNEVKKAQEIHIETRQSIIIKHNKIMKDLFYMDGKKKAIVTAQQVSQSLEDGLKDWPEKAEFSYEGHDPDFGGGLHEPCTCSECGEPFVCSFTPNQEEADHLLSEVIEQVLSDRFKWEAEIALYHYEYCTEPVKAVLEKLAIKILEAFPHPMTETTTNK